MIHSHFGDSSTASVWFFFFFLKKKDRVIKFFKIFIWEIKLFNFLENSNQPYYPPWKMYLHGEIYHPNENQIQNFSQVLFKTLKYSYQNIT